MDNPPGATAAWDAPEGFGGAPWPTGADLEDFSWFGAPLEADLTPPMQSMQPVGAARLPPPPLPLTLAADPLGPEFELLLAQSPGAAQPQWAQQFAQPQYQQEQQLWDLAQPAPQQPAGGGGARSGRRAASAADAAEARRARNRVAQARFREKQKAKDAALIAQHAATSAELERTRQELGDLAVHGQVLQMALDAKDFYIAVLGAAAERGSHYQQRPPSPPQQQHAQQGMLQAPAAVPAAEEAAAAAAAVPQPVPKPRQPSGADLAGVPLASAVKEQLQRMSECPVSFLAQADLPPTAHPDEAMAVAVAHQEGTLAVPRKHSLEALVQERPDLVQKVQEASPHDLVAGWRRFAAAFKEILARYDATGSAAELEQIHRIFREFSGQMAITLHYKPENAQALFATGDQAPPGHWERIAACLEPTEAQRATLRHVLRDFAAQLQAIRAEQAQAVEAAVAAGAVTPDNLPASTLGGLMNGYLALFEATGQISMLQDEEFVARLQLLARVGTVFSPLQKARVAAASSPYFPDSVHLVRLLAEGGPAPRSSSSRGSSSRGSSSGSRRRASLAVLPAAGEQAQACPPACL